MTLLRKRNTTCEQYFFYVSHVSKEIVTGPGPGPGPYPGPGHDTWITDWLLHRHLSSRCTRLLALRDLKRIGSRIKEMVSLILLRP